MADSGTTSSDALNTSAPSLPLTRGYQQEMLEASLRRNVVIAMDTGSGKTHIAVLRMKIEAQREQKKISWFLAPTVGLCEQQRSVIRTSLPLPVGLISGALEPDQWTDASLWENALSTHRIIVSTPQVLLDALRHGYVNFGKDIGLLIFDEAHHAADKHPYNMIMQEFYWRCAPRTGAATGVVDETQLRPFVLGLTASPIFGGNIESAFRKIEKNLDSIILAPSRTRPELRQHVHQPAFKHILYPPSDYRNASSHNVDALGRVVKSLRVEDDPSVLHMRTMLEKLRKTEPEGKESAEYRRIDQRLSRAIYKKDTFVNEGLRSFERTAKELCADIGPWAADWYVYSVIAKTLGSQSKSAHAYFAERNHGEKEYLSQILRAIDVRAPDYDPAAICNGCSVKAERLIQCLQAEKSEWESLGQVYSGLVFATRRDAVLALEELLTHHPETKEKFVVGALLGSSENSKRNSFLDITCTLLKQTQVEALADFRVGLKNLVVSTAVAEEGIDIQACGNVVRWDLPQNMVSWAQSRGRARQKRSSIVLMFPIDGPYSALIKKWELLEAEMIRKYMDEQRHFKDITEQSEKCSSAADEYDEYRLQSSGAVITLGSAVSHLAHFCNVLTNASRDPEQPTYDIFPPDYPEGFHSAVDRQLILPNLGPFGCTLVLPKLLPAKLRVYTTEQKYPSKEAARRRAAFMAYVAMYHAGLLNDSLLPLSSSLVPMQEDEVKKLLQNVEKREGLASVHEQLNPWLVLTPTSSTRRWWTNELRIEGIGSFIMLTQRQIPQLQFCEKLHDPDYGTRLFSIIPGNASRLAHDDIQCAKQYTRRIFSIFYGSRMNWNVLDYAYMFLPPAGLDDSVWEMRREWADGTRVAGRNHTARDMVLVNAISFTREFRFPDDVHTILEKSSRGSKFYQFCAWRHARLTLEDEERLLKRYTDVKGEHAQIKYPIIVARNQRNRINFLTALDNESVKEEEIYVLPQFTSIVLASKTDVKLSLLLPSILRIAFIKLIAHSLQDTLSNRAPELRVVSLDLIKSALTAPVAKSDSNYQRLETLGDTILKFITIIQLLAEHPHWPEGYLSRAKDHAVSNANLAKSAIGQHLYRWIIRKVFCVRKWKPDYWTQPTSETDGSNEEEGNGELSSDAEVVRGKEGNFLVKLSTKTLADVVESLIGAAYLSGGFECSIACAKVFEIAIDWQPIPTRIASILSRADTAHIEIGQLRYPEFMLGYEFKRKLLLVEALTHATSQCEFDTVSYERMEFLGDAVLDVVVCEALYNAGGKEYAPGQMHIRKSAVVNSHFLAYVCLRTHVVLDSKMPRWEAARGTSIRTDRHMIHLWQCLLHSSHTILDEQADTYTRYTKVKDEVEQAFETGSMYPWAALARIQAPKLLSDIVESLIGAVYLDAEGNMDVVRQVLETLGVLPILHRIIRDNVDVRHPISRVSNWATKYQQGIEYQISSASGRVTCTMLLNDEAIHTVTARDTGKASQEEVKFRVAEEGLEILVEKYGPESEEY